MCHGVSPRGQADARRLHIVLHAVRRAPLIPMPLPFYCYWETVTMEMGLTEWEWICFWNWIIVVRY